MRDTKKNRKGVSLMIAYALLIVIAIGLAVGVYMWINDMIPIFDKDECPEDVSVVILEYNCFPDADEMQLTIKNKGLHNIDGYYIKGTDNAGGIADVDLKGSGDFESGVHSITPALVPNENDEATFSYSSLSELKKIEIEPFRFQKKKRGVEREIIVLCDEAFLIQEIEGCN